MRRSVVIFLTTLLSTPASSSIATERDQPFEIAPGRSKGRSPASAANESQAIAKLIDDINVAVRADKRRILSIITINTDVAAATLEQEKARTGFSFGEIYVAHSLALATRKKFSAIVALKTSGQSWAQIAHAHKVTLKGSRELLQEMQKK